MNPEGGEEEVGARKRFGFGLRYHSLQEKGGELGLALVSTGRTMLPSPACSRGEKTCDG